MHTFWVIMGVGEWNKVIFCSPQWGPKLLTPFLQAMLLVTCKITLQATVYRDLKSTTISGRLVPDVYQAIVTGDALHLGSSLFPPGESMPTAGMSQGNYKGNSADA